jgi:hypothetical protein
MTNELRRLALSLSLVGLRIAPRFETRGFAALLGMRAINHLPLIQEAAKRPSRRIRNGGKIS